MLSKGPRGQSLSSRNLDEKAEGGDGGAGCGDRKRLLEAATIVHSSLKLTLAKI
jgi:hypothetical protein